MKNKCAWTAETPDQAENYKWYPDCRQKESATNYLGYEEFGDEFHGYKPSECGYQFCPYCGKPIFEVGE